ncbi:Uma2 family endonuclease [Argonema galeatum]|uniref:Uma2 family endonuclease n=1 Tax=Argonema galeatum TaxID=2942762 RepID=UPI0020132508|nr:Uma2 family endonuclease [Argonema galeatum]MCL1465797.1 Uma2 family endonuclease [Argonema galeatum A003/A1]
MTPKLLETPNIKTIAEQRITLSSVTWQQYETLRSILYHIPGVRTAYLDGEVEILTLSKEHEKIKSQISRLLDTYLDEAGIDFYRLGSPTMGGGDESASGEPDESYCIGEEKVVPDLVIEVIISSGTLNRREIFRRMGVKEAWFWKNSQLSIYHLQEDGDQKISRSQLLPNLDVNLFLIYVNHPDQKVAVREFRAAIRQQMQQL